MPRFRNSSTFYWLAAFALLGAGVLLRARGLGRSLWQDEAWVANSVLADSLQGMFFYDAWLQTTPPLFLLMIRAAVGAFGLQEWCWRLVPFCWGVAGCLMMAVLLMRLPDLSAPLRVWLLALFVLSSSGIHFSYSLKQYVPEMAVTAGLLLATVFYLERRSRRRFFGLMAAMLAGMSLSYGSVLVFPGIMLATSPWFARWARLDVGEDNPGAAAGQWSVVWGLVLAAFALEYWAFISPNRTAELDGYWLHPPHSTLFGYINEAYSGVFVLLHHVPLPRVLLSFTGARIAALVSALLILPALYRRMRRGIRPESLLETAALISAVALVTMIAASLLRIYPLVMRTSLPFLPCVVIVIGYGFHIVRKELIEPLRGGLRRAALMTIWAAALLLTVFGLELRWNPHGEEELRGAMAYLKREMTANDRLYVHATCIEGYKLYTRILGWEPAGTVFGQFGFPCCPRPDVITDYTDERALQRDLSRILESKPSGTLYILHTGKPGVTESLAIMDRVFPGAGCAARETPRFYSTVVRSFDCSGS